MTTQHTPGPWNVGQDSTAIEASGAIIARTFHWANQYTPIHESYANAKLIAAAPDLLAALEECLQRLDSHDDQSVPECLVALAAIKKATGK